MTESWTPAPPTLAALEAQIARDLELLNAPPPDWTVARSGPDGRPLLDVAVVGAGMCGIAAALSLKLKGIRNIRMLDDSDAGREGPWVTFARMETLRSPKHLTGPAMGIPSLTFRAWYEAQHGAAGWEALYKIPRQGWMDYLTWIREVTDLPVENGVSVAAVEPADGCVKLRLVTAEGSRTEYARRVVLATGRGGAGGATIPEFVDRSLWHDLAAHTVEDIDFARLAQKRVAVLGAGASAWDNAACALEAGAARVDMYVRRPILPQINKSKATVYPGFQWGYAALDDAARWEALVYLHDTQAPPPHETVLRALAAGVMKVHLSAPMVEARRAGDRVHIRIAGWQDAAEADFLILGTGFQIDLSASPATAAIAPHAATWADRYVPPPALRRSGLGRYPYLGGGFELVERVGGACPEIGRIHLFNIGATASHGALTGDIPGIVVGAERLGIAVAKALFVEDYPQLFGRLKLFAEPELRTTPFFVADALPTADRLP
ncbi:MAG TPA: NAD(P)/FAD-dependent oxidoreductase [Alphaproteobacteria bacterium]|nr:NAD(P)/FAD-dependent oxidoreductase [Alphaproteobacteria bacterium]